MARQIQDITDLFHGARCPHRTEQNNGASTMITARRDATRAALASAAVDAVLLGGTFSYLLWVSLNRVYAQAMMARMALIIVLLISLRLLTSIRLESGSSASCYIWILCRSTISLFGIFALNLFYQTQMFVSLALGHLPAAQKHRTRRALHAVMQTLNLANVVQYLTVMHARTNAAGYCALVEDDVVPLTVLTILSFGCMLVMNVALLVNRTAFTAMREVSRLFRGIAASCTLLCLWVTLIHLDSLYLPWADWKSVYFTVMLVWMSVNSLLINNYLIRAKLKATRLSGVGGTGSGTAARTSKTGSTGAGAGGPRPSLISGGSSAAAMPLDKVGGGMRKEESSTTVAALAPQVGKMAVMMKRGESMSNKA
ncbi:hypothetical protein GGF32_001434 [Allomyces javanicus]|nr:hypothetical protein GGF32_001434 [Allomyces javanicus]